MQLDNPSQVLTSLNNKSFTYVKIEIKITIRASLTVTVPKRVT